MCHCLLPVHKSIIENEVKNLGAQLNLLLRDRDCFLVIVVDNQLLEGQATSDVTPLTDVDKGNVIWEDELGHATKHGLHRILRHLTSFNSLYSLV